MQLYVDGVESSVQQRVDELHEQVGLATHSNDPDPPTRTLGVMQRPGQMAAALL
jgi:hypothetical protein